MRKADLEEWVRQVEDIYRLMDDAAAKTAEMIDRYHVILDEAENLGGVGVEVEVGGRDLAGILAMACIGQAWLFSRDEMPGVFPKRSELESSDN